MAGLYFPPPVSGDLLPTKARLHITANCEWLCIALIHRYKKHTPHSALIARRHGSTSRPHRGSRLAQDLTAFVTPSAASPEPIHESARRCYVLVNTKLTSAISDSIFSSPTHCSRPSGPRTFLFLRISSNWPQSSFT